MKFTPLFTLAMPLLMIAAPGHAAAAYATDQLAALNPVRTVTRPLTPLRDQIKSRIPLKEKPPTVVDDTIAPLQKIWQQLPARLPIVDKDGDEALVEVRVENGARAIEHEWLLSVGDDAVALLDKFAFPILARTRYAELGFTVIRFRVPAKQDSRAALIALLPAVLHDDLDRNHVFDAQALMPAPETPERQPTPVERTACATPLSIGMIDTAIDGNHPALASAPLQQRNFLTDKLDAPRDHGTAVASLFIARSAELTPLLPQAQVYAASVFYQRDAQSQGATTALLVQALNWLLGHGFAVINMSLTGPPNVVLQQAIVATQKRGAHIVAAAGNAGPTAAPLYPAAYAGVIAVTAVDDDAQIYRWANRGEHISFAARGVDVVSAQAGGGIRRNTGTSFASPVVTALYACALINSTDNDVLDTLLARTKDLGASGRDPVYGWGLLQP